MTIFKRFFCSLTAFFAASFVLVSPAQEPYPSKTISIVVPQAPGGASDVTLRLLAQQLTGILNQPVVVENKAGAGGNLGTVFVARSKSDGYTLLFNQTSHVINPSLYSKAGYDNARDFIPIASVADGAFLLVSSVKSDIKSVEDLVTRAKRRPGEIRYGSAGNGTVNHLAGAMLEKTANIDLLHVPYKGGAESGLGLAAGDVDISFQAPASALPFVQRGQIRVIAQTNPQRQSSYPSTPTIGETLRGYGVTPWYGLFAPKGTPDAVVHTINVAVNKALASKEFQDKLLAIGLTPTPRSQIEFARWVTEESEKWQRVVKESGATID